MKQFCFAFIALIFISGAQAQLQIKQTPAERVIGEVKAAGTLLHRLTERSTDGDTVYYLMFRNARYTALVDYESVAFSYAATVTDLYNVMSSFFTPENRKNKDYKVAMTLGDQDVRLSLYRLLGVTHVYFWCDKGYFYLTEKQMNQLFGK